MFFACCCPYRNVFTYMLYIHTYSDLRVTCIFIHARTHVSQLRNTLFANTFSFPISFPISILTSRNPMHVRNTLGRMQQEDFTPSSSTSVVTASYDSSLVLRNPVISSPPSPVPVPRRLVPDYARQITKKKKFPIQKESLFLTSLAVWKKY